VPGSALCAAFAADTRRSTAGARFGFATSTCGHAAAFTTDRRLAAAATNGRFPAATSERSPAATRAGSRSRAATFATGGARSASASCGGPAFARRSQGWLDRGNQVFVAVTADETNRSDERNA
jgi:hypothetical protein